MGSWTNFIDNIVILERLSRERQASDKHFKTLNMFKLEEEVTSLSYSSQGEAEENR